MKQNRIFRQNILDIQSSMSSNMLRILQFLRRHILLNFTKIAICYNKYDKVFKKTMEFGKII